LPPARRAVPGELSGSRTSTGAPAPRPARGLFSCAAGLPWRRIAAGIIMPQAYTKGGTQMARGLVQDEDLLDRIIQERKRMGIDLYDEVWEGMYVMPSLPSLEHQKLVLDLSMILVDV